MSLELRIEELNRSVVELIDVLKTMNLPVIPIEKQKTVEEPVKVVNLVKEEPVLHKETENELPFSDFDGLLSYVMDSYKKLGPQKGAEIQTIMTKMGYNNINDIKPMHYSVLYEAIEALLGN